LSLEADDEVEMTTTEELPPLEEVNVESKMEEVD